MHRVTVTPAAGEQGDLIVKPYSSWAIKANLNVEIDLLVEDLEPFITNQIMGFIQATASGYNLNAALVVRYHRCMKQELETINTTENSILIWPL